MGLKLQLVNKNKQVMEEKVKVEQQIKVLNITDETEFESTVNTYLEDDWKISSTSCGFINSENYDFCTSFQAILIKEGVD